MCSHLLAERTIGLSLFSRHFTKSLHNWRHFPTVPWRWSWKTSIKAFEIFCRAWVGAENCCWWQGNEVSRWQQHPHRNCFERVVPVRALHGTETIPLMSNVKPCKYHPRGCSLSSVFVTHTLEWRVVLSFSSFVGRARAAHEHPQILRAGDTSKERALPPNSHWASLRKACCPPTRNPRRWHWVWDAPASSRVRAAAPPSSGRAWRCTQSWPVSQEWAPIAPAHGDRCTPRRALY